MAIVFVHGVAVRHAGDPGFEQVTRTTGGIQWDRIEARLRTSVAPVLNEQHPEQVDIRQAYWGDLGASYGLGGRSLGSWRMQAAAPDLSDLSADEVGERLEDEFFRTAPTRDWPAVLDVVWGVARDANLRGIMHALPTARQWPFLVAAVEARLPHPTLRKRLETPHLPRPLMAQRRSGLSRTLSTVRRPIEDFVPLFLGDVLAYLSGRGTPGQPGPIMVRVIETLLAAHAAAPDEPLIVLTHSMGGQLMYDALTAFLPADPRCKGLKVDFWCACGSQVGLFRELGQATEHAPLPTPALLNSPHCGYFWNVWSYSDFLSFRAEGVVLGAHDTAFPFTGNVRSDHLSYLGSADFYRVLAAKVRLHARSKTV